MNPFFSVVIPLYNKENYIEATLNSVLNQTFQDFEVVIVNDGSTDKGVEIVSSFHDDRIRLINQKNQGASAARNKGIILSAGQFIALLDGDDLWYKNHLNELLFLTKKFPNAGLFCNNYEIVLENGFIRKTKFNFKHNDNSLIVTNYFDASLIDPVAWTSAVCFSRNDYLDLGGFDLKLLSGQDTDLWIRFALSFKVAFNPKITACYNNHIENSLSKNDLNTIRKNIFNKYKQIEKTNPQLKKYLDIIRYSLAISSILKNDMVLFNELKKNIVLSNLNIKQKLLLSLPRPMLSCLFRIQKKLISYNIYITAYK
ncbi:glycosyltransferase family 2 protein [Cognatitamlana onchidii]|uniref:glycosyltransferase family 2 protein n=1 Tax=Cognatitamlana onchidii TaxID=2562860 RepID=UPI0010A61523|nr:glycosyltransferase [Algibacter onchidii]